MIDNDALLVGEPFASNPGLAVTITVFAVVEAFAIVGESVSRIFAVANLTRPVFLLGPKMNPFIVNVRSQMIALLSSKLPSYVSDTFTSFRIIGMSNVAPISGIRFTVAVQSGVK